MLWIDLSGLTIPIYSSVLCWFLDNHGMHLTFEHPKWYFAALLWFWGVKIDTLLTNESRIDRVHCPLVLVNRKWTTQELLWKNTFSLKLRMLSETIKYITMKLLSMKLLANEDNDAIQANQERFDDHEPIKDDDDDDDINDLDNYLIPQDASYYVDKEEERFKERKSKLLEITYEKPPTIKSEKFKVIKYSLGPAEEYVAIKE
nr:hypothetical protein [Tanacetum cinerariifolium]